VKPRNGIFIKSISIRRRSRYRCDFCFSPELISRIRSPAAISPAGMSHWRLHTARNRRRLGARSDRAALRNIRPCHVSALTRVTISRPNTRSCFMTPVCWRCFSRPTALFPGTPTLLPSVSTVSTLCYSTLHVAVAFDILKSYGEILRDASLCTFLLSSCWTIAYFLIIII